MSTSSRLVDEFRKFADVSRGLLANLQEETPLASFRDFVDHAEDLLQQAVAKQLPHIRKRLACLQTWLLPEKCDLLQVAGLSYVENSYTELIAWCLDPKTDIAAALACQRSLLAIFGVPDFGDRKVPAQPRTQFVTFVKAIPDLVLQYDNLLVVVEAKTGTGEHETPTGENQTVAYPKAVRSTLGLPENFATVMVYLTPDRSSPAAAAAVAVSYLEIAIAFAAGLQAVVLNEDVKTLYKLVITHLATCAVQPQPDVRGLCRLLREDAAARAQIVTHTINLMSFLLLVPEEAAR